MSTYRENAKNSSKTFCVITAFNATYLKHIIILYFFGQFLLALQNLYPINALIKSKDDVLLNRKNGIKKSNTKTYFSKKLKINIYLTGTYTFITSTENNILKKHSRVLFIFLLDKNI